MLYEQTMQKLHNMKLNGIADALEEQRQQPKITELSFEERLGLLVERQWLWKENRALTRRLLNAKLKISSACVENLKYRASRELSRDQIEQLAGNDWVRQGRSCLVTGATGTGKTYLACALGHQACRDGYSVQYWYAPRLFRELCLASLDGSLSLLLKKIARIELLIIDDFGLEAVKPVEYRRFLEVLDDRYGTHATLVTSQWDHTTWHSIIADITVADAILDRLAHTAYRFPLSGGTMRGTSPTGLVSPNSNTPSGDTPLPT